MVHSNTEEEYRFAGKRKTFKKEDNSETDFLVFWLNNCARLNTGLIFQVEVLLTVMVLSFSAFATT